MPNQAQWDSYLSDFYARPQSRMEGFRADLPNGFAPSYEEELARAERNKSDEERASELQSQRLLGTFEFNQLVNKGVPHAQALLQTLPKIFAGEPDKMVRAAKDIQEFSAPQTSLIPSAPQIVDLEDGLQARRTGPKTWDYAQKKDESEKIQNDIKKMELNAAMRELNSARAAMFDPLTKGNAEKRLPSLEARVAELQEQMIVGATPKTNAAPEKPAEPPKRNTITRESPGGGFEIRREEVQVAPPPTEVKPAKSDKKLTEGDARSILKEAGGDKEKARKLARERGYVF